MPPVNNNPPVSVGNQGMKPDPARDLPAAYVMMKAHFGHLNWWPGETPFEVCVGAILTQNTSWSNVEKAISNLKRISALNPHAIHGLSAEALSEEIRSAGYFRVKAIRLKAFVKVLVDQFDGSLTRLFDGDLSTVRTRLLGIHGIGPETADCMLLYAGKRPSFVIDAYTKRIFLRHGWCHAKADYDEIQGICMQRLSHVAREQLLDYWQDYHAQLVMVGKHYCKTQKPLCTACPLNKVPPGFKLAQCSG